MIMFVIVFAMLLWCLAWLIVKLARTPKPGDHPEAGTAEDNQPVR